MMKYINKQVLMLMSSIVLLSACNKDEIDTFSTESSGVYFKTNNSEYSFIDTPDAEYYDMTLPINLIGLKTDYDRVVDVIVDEENTTANSNQYKLISADVKADELSGTVVIRIFNDKEVLENGDLVVSLKLRDNNHFTTAFDPTELGPASGALLNTGTKLTWTSQLPMPEYWLKSSWHRYVTYTAIYYDGTNVYSEAGEGRTLGSAKYRNTGVYSRKLGEIMRKVWPEKLNINGYLGRDEATLEKYPMVIVTQPLGKALIHKLQSYVDNYNLEHPDAPLRHSEDAAAYGTNGNIVNVSLGGKSYPLVFKDRPLIKINGWDL